MRSIVCALFLVVACSSAASRAPEAGDGGTLHYSGEQRCGYAHRYKLALKEGDPFCVPPPSEIELAAFPDGGGTLWARGGSFPMETQSGAEGLGNPCELSLAESAVIERSDGGAYVWGMTFTRDPVDLDAGPRILYGEMVSTDLPDGGYFYSCSNGGVALVATPLP